jgi:hypothetical protein
MIASPELTPELVCRCIILCDGEDVTEHCYWADTVGGYVLLLLLMENGKTRMIGPDIGRDDIPWPLLYKKSGAVQIIPYPDHDPPYAGAAIDEATW